MPTRADLRTRFLAWAFFTRRGLATMAVLGVPVVVVGAPFVLPVVGLAIGIDKFNAWRNR